LRKKEKKGKAKEERRGKLKEKEREKKSNSIRPTKLEVSKFGSVFI
jgi:hypothetical protein